MPHPSRHGLRRLAFSSAILLLILPSPVASAPSRDSKPNILVILADNLGYGEVGAYGGGITRGAPTPRIDSIAADGLRLTNANMETQCTPSRSALMTGRFAIRSGTYAVPFGGVPDGLTQWEVTVGEALSNAGYATGYFGKWHLGSLDGRLPNDQGFDTWFGIPRTTDEVTWSRSPNWSPDVAPLEKIMEGQKGQKSRALRDYDWDQRRLIDREVTLRTIDFMKQQNAAGEPFFAYVSLTQPHLPTEPNPDFAGKTGNGNWADMLAEMDHHVGQMLDALDALGRQDDTIVIFTSDNGPEFVQPWDGWAGPWRGQYFTHLEGGIRVPFMVRWPGKIAAGRVSNELLHGVDLFPTLAALAGADVPRDRPIDGVDQSDFILGQSESSGREAIPIWCADRLQAVKWRNYKMHFYQQETMFSPPVKLPIPFIINLFTDPQERKPTVDTWVVGPILRVVAEFEASLEQHPLIPMGTPDPFEPQ